MRLLFVSNLFPDTREPYRGLDNATVLDRLTAHWDIRVLGLRPTLPLRSGTWTARDDDRRLQPQFLATPYLPKIGSRWNHQLMARALRGPLREIGAHFPYDLVLSSWIYPDSCAVARLAQEIGFPFVSIAQGSDVHQYLRHPVRRKIIARSMPGAASIITRSGELGRLLGEAGIDRDKLHTVYNGVDHSVFKPGDRAAARQALNLPPDLPIILFVGNFYPIKNPILLVEAHAHVCNNDHALLRTKLIMLGGGPLTDSARTLADRLQFGPNVLLPGRKSAKEVARYMQAADVLCIPSVNEGVPNVVLEAFACGLPVVASRVGGLAEVHPGETCGRLIEPHLAPLTAALRSVLREPPAREVIAAHGAQFTWERAAAQYHDVLAAAVRP